MVHVVVRHEFVNGRNVFIVPNFFENATQHFLGIRHVFGLLAARHSTLVCWDCPRQLIWYTTPNAPTTGRRKGTEFQSTGACRQGERLASRPCSTAAGADPFVFLAGRPAAHWTADARRLRVGGFLLFFKLPILHST